MQVEAPDASIGRFAYSGDFIEIDVAPASDIARTAKGKFGRILTRTIDTEAGTGTLPGDDNY